jgi:exopolysaccharide biosynthesis operon protein EpsL
MAADAFSIKCADAAAPNLEKRRSALLRRAGIAAACGLLLASLSQTGVAQDAMPPDDPTAPRNLQNLPPGWPTTPTLPPAPPATPGVPDILFSPSQRSDIRPPEPEAIEEPSAPGTPAEVAAVPRRPVTVVAGEDLSYDSNLFRQPSFANPQSDWVSVSHVGLRYDQQVSLQRFQADLIETIRRYDRNTQLNFNSLDYRAAWLWQMGNRFSGTLSADRSQSLVPFEIVNNGSTRRNVRTNRNEAFTADAWLFGDWHLLGGFSKNKQSADQATTGIQPNFDAIGRELGIRYLAQTGSAVSLVRRSISGDYLGSGDTTVGSGYTEDNTEFRVTWVPTVKSTFFGRATRLSRDQTNAPQRNYTGWAGELGYAWAPREQLSFNFAVRRDIVPFLDVTGTHITADSITATAHWRIAARTAAHLGIGHTVSDYQGAASVPLTGPQRRDTDNGINVGVDWSPKYWVTLAAGYQYQIRSSNGATFEFTDNIVRLTALLRF